MSVRGAMERSKDHRGRASKIWARLIGEILYVSHSSLVIKLEVMRTVSSSTGAWNLESMGNDDLMELQCFIPT